MENILLWNEPKSMSKDGVHSIASFVDKLSLNSFFRKVPPRRTKRLGPFRERPNGVGQRCFLA